MAVKVPNLLSWLTPPAAGPFNTILFLIIAITEAISQIVKIVIGKMH
jgi:hypothetical protein